MQPQFFPWLFDDKTAWEKSLADPRYSYELPIENFMTLYGAVRTAHLGEEAIPAAASIPLAAPPIFASAPITAVPLAPIPLQTAPAASSSATADSPKEESKIEDGVLSQDEIDALLSGL